MGSNHLSPPRGQPRTINVLIFGQTNAAKDSVINSMARKKIAEATWAVDDCTLQYNYHYIPFDDTNLAVFDVIGLSEPLIGGEEFLKAIQNAYNLINMIDAAGGVDLLLFCICRGRLSMTILNNFLLFWNHLCDERVPIALVFTGFETNEQTEDWWRRNKDHIESYGIKSDGHACLATVKDDVPTEDEYLRSQEQETIRELVRNCVRNGAPFSLEPQAWFARFAGRMKNFVRTMESPTKKDIVQVMMHRYQLDVGTAKRIADIVERGGTDSWFARFVGQMKNFVRTIESPTKDVVQVMMHRRQLGTAKRIADNMERDDTKSQAENDEGGHMMNNNPSRSEHNPEPGGTENVVLLPRFSNLEAKPGVVPHGESGNEERGRQCST